MKSLYDSESGLPTKDWQRWDQQLESDVAAGKLDFLLAEAIAAKSQGKLQNL